MDCIIEEAKTKNILIRITNMSECLWGFVYSCIEDHYHVIINAKLSLENQTMVAMHELNHIKQHLPLHNYFIGINMQHSEIEKEADYFFIP